MLSPSPLEDCKIWKLVVNRYQKWIQRSFKPIERHPYCISLKFWAPLPLRYYNFGIITELTSEFNYVILTLPRPVSRLSICSNDVFKTVREKSGLTHRTQKRRPRPWRLTLDLVARLKGCCFWGARHFYESSSWSDAWTLSLRRVPVRWLWCSVFIHPVKLW